MRTTRTLKLVRPLLLAILACSWSFQASQAQLLVDDFNRPNNNVVGNGWTEYETIPPTSVRIQGNVLRLESNVAGRDFVSRVTPGDYEVALAENPCVLEWAFNMQQNSLNPGGMTPLNHGLAMVLAGSSGNLLQGQGYAVVLGTTGTTVNPLRLVRYSNGLTHNNVLTNLISVGNFNNQGLAVRVTYDPTTGIWEMFYGQNPVSFPDPTTASISAGTSTDAFYVNTPLPYIGCLWNHGTVNTTRASFDNIHVPFGCSSRVEFEGPSGTVSSSAGTVSIPLVMEFPHMSNAANVTVELVSGDASVIDGAVSSIVTFAPGSSTATLELDLPFDGSCTGDKVLVFNITGITGGFGTAFVGPENVYTLTVVDEQSAQVQVLHESFETDGAGTRYTLNVPHASPVSGSYFLRGNNAAMTAAGGLSMSNINGTSFIGGANLTGIAPNAEAIITFNDLDILGLSDVVVGIRAGARYATNYDQALAQRDYLFVEVNVDGAGWVAAGAFRSHKENPFVDGWFAHDTDLDGVGDGIRLNQIFRIFNFDLPSSGTSMDLRVRMRSTDAQEDIFFDDIRVEGTLCQPVYFSRGSGAETDAIWSTTRTGTATTISLDRNVTIVIQDGHIVTASGTERQVKELTVETGGSLALGTAMWEVHGENLMNDGGISATTGGLRMIAAMPAMIEGAGTYDLYDLAFTTPAGVTASSSIDIRGTLSIDEGVLDATAATIRLISTADGTGRLGPVVPGADYVGDLTVQRFIPAGQTNWRSLGSPVAGATVMQWQDDFYTAGYPGSHFPSFYSPPGSGIHWPSIRWYDETVPGPDQNDGLVGVTSSAMPLGLGQGFAAWCGTTLTTTTAFTIDVTGAPHIAHSPITLPMTYTNTGAPSVDGFNLVSNPLASPVAFSEIVLGADVEGSYWIYNPANGSNASWNGVVGTNGANGIIQSSQAFWLKANGPAVTTTIGENAKVAGNTGGLFGMQINDLPMMRLEVVDAQMEYSDETVIVFGMGTPVKEDTDVLKMKFRHPQAPLIFSHSAEGVGLAINMYGMPETAVSIPLDIEVASTGTYSIKISDIDIIAGLSCVKLKDHLTGEEYPLSEGSIFEFEIEAGTNDTPRFTVELTQSIQRGVVDASCYGSEDGSVTVTVVNGPADLVLMNAFSGVIDQQTGTVVSFNGLAAGDYMLSVSDDAGCGALLGSFRIEQPNPLEALFTATVASCGLQDGSLTAEVLGGTAPYTLEWSNGSTSAETVAGAGVYSLSVTDMRGCEYISAPQPIIAENGPIAQFEPAQDDIYPGQSVTFINLSSAADTYVWNMGDGSIIEAPQVTYMFGLAGPQTITLTATRGECSDVVSKDIWVIGATSIQEATSSDVHVWYDGNNINVRHDLDGKTLTIELLDATGRTHARTTRSSAPGHVIVPASDLSSGVWFIRMSNDLEQISRRVVIAR